MSEISRLRWRCRRGMRELDVVLLRYLEGFYPGASDEEQEAFRLCLELQDPEIMGMLTGSQPCNDVRLAGVFDKIRTTFDPPSD